MDISATAQSADQAAQIANLVGDELTTFVESSSSPTRLRSGVRAITLAAAPGAASSPNVPRNLALGLFLGLLLGVGTAALRHALDTSIHGEQESRNSPAEPSSASFPSILQRRLIPWGH